MPNTNDGSTQTGTPAKPKPFPSQSAIRAAELKVLEERIAEMIDKRQRETAKTISALSKRVTALEKSLKRRAHDDA